MPWTARRSNQSILKEINHWKDWCWSWSSNTLATWCEELTHWKRPWCAKSRTWLNNWTELKVYSLKHSSNNEISGWWNCLSLFLSTSLLVRCGLILITLTLWNSQQKLKNSPGMRSNFLGEVHPSDVRQSKSRSQWCFQRQIWMKRGKYEMWNKMHLLMSVQFSSVTQSCPTLMSRSF